MEELDAEKLLAELEQFKAEKEKIRKLIGQIGGTTSARRDSIITWGLVAVMVILFVLDICRHLIGIHIPLPPLFSLEVGVMMVSVKVIMMLHNQTRMEHFQFWILNSIEFRLNEVSHEVRQIKKCVVKPEE